MQMEDRLSSALADVDDDTVVVEARIARGSRDELEHTLRLGIVERANVAERVDVPLGDHQQVRRRLRRDVADRDEAIALRDVVAFPGQPAEEAVVRQRRLPLR